MTQERLTGPATHDARHDASLVDRRSYLRFAGAAVAAAGGVASVGAASASRRVDITDADADSSGNDRINDILERIHGDGVEVYFPPGTYRLDPISLEGSDWSLVGDDATLVVPARVDGDYLSFGGSNWTVNGFTVDLSAGGAAPANELRGDDWTFRNVEFVGRAEGSGGGDPSLLSATVESDDATGRLERVVTVAGRDASADPPGRRILRVGPDSEGRLDCRGCEFVGPAAGAVSAAGAAGRIVVEDCLFENAGGVRVGGDALIRSCAWRTGRRDADSIERRTVAAASGLELGGDQNAAVDAVVEECEFEMLDSDAPAVRSRGELDGLTLRDVRIEQANGRGAVRLSGQGPTTVERTSVTGDSAAPAITVSGSGGTVLRNVCVRQPGDGIRVADAADCRVVDSTLDVGGDAFVSDGAVTTRNVSFEGACPAPRLLDCRVTDSSDRRFMIQNANLPNTIAIEGTGSPATYEFTVGGELERVSPTSHPDAWDGVSGTTATGWVSTPACADTFRFSGSVTDFRLLEGDATVYVDGERTDPSALPSETTLPRTITVTGTGTAAEYEFSVDGELEADSERGDPDQWGNVSGATASGWVATSRHVDSYRFSGDLTEFAVRGGSLSVTVDGDEVDASRL